MWGLLVQWEFKRILEWKVEDKRSNTIFLRPLCVHSKGGKWEGREKLNFCDYHWKVQEKEEMKPTSSYSSQCQAKKETKQVFITLKWVPTANLVQVTGSKDIKFLEMQLIAKNFYPLPATHIHVQVINKSLKYLKLQQLRLGWSTSSLEWIRMDRLPI